MNLSDFNWPLFIPSAITLIAGVLSIIFASKSKTVRQVGVLLIGIAIVLCVAGLFVPNNDPNQTTAEAHINANGHPRQ